MDRFLFLTVDGLSHGAVYAAFALRSALVGSDGRSAIAVADPPGTTSPFDVNVPELLAFHQKHKRLATVTAVRPPARYGELIFDGDQVAAASLIPETEAALPQEDLPLQ